MASERSRDARERAQKLVQRAAKDGKLTGSDFKEEFQRSFGGLAGPGTNNSYVATAIARALRDNPDLKIGERSTRYTGVSQTKGGQLVHELSEPITGSSKGQAIEYRAYEGPGSPKWVQNSKGSYTYIGDLSPRQRKEKEEEGDTSKEPESISDPFDDLSSNGNSSASGETDDTYGGGYTTGGSIAFNPGADMIQSAANFGNDSTDDYFRRFLPESYAVAQRGTDEISASAQYHLDRFIGKVPKLGDGKKLYNHFIKKLR